MDRLIHAIRESLDVAHNLSAAHILLGGMQSAIRDLLDVWACGDDVARERPEICAEHEERKKAGDTASAEQAGQKREEPPGDPGDQPWYVAEIGEPVVRGLTPGCTWVGHRRQSHSFGGAR
jgi:hypothetical protein